MSGLFGRLANAFLAPPGAEPHARGSGPPAPARRPPTSAKRPPSPSAVAVLCRPQDALVAGGATALLLAARARSSHSLVTSWAGDATPAAPLRAPTSGAARRLAATLAARGHHATASGRLAVVRLASELSEASAEAVRAAAAAGDVPTVVVLAGPRDDAADQLLRAQDAVLVAIPAGSDPAVADLAIAGLTPLGVDARAVELPPAAAPARALAAAGVAVMAPLRGALERGLEGVR